MNVIEDQDEAVIAVPPRTVASAEQDQILVELFQKVRQGQADAQTWNSLYCALSLLIHSTAFRILGDYHVAEDVMQEVFVRIQENTADFHVRTVSVEVQAAQIRTWVVRIAINQAINISTRRPKMGLELTDRVLKKSKSQASVAETHDCEIAMIRIAMADLDENLRVPLVLRYFEKYTFQEIGQALGVSINCAKYRVDQALDHIRQRFMKAGMNASLVVGLLQEIGSAAIVIPNSVPSQTLGSSQSCVANTVKTQTTAKVVVFVAFTILGCLGITGAICGFASMSSPGSFSVAYVGTLANTAGWRSRSVAKPAGADPNGDGALGSDGYWLQTDSVLSNLPSYIGNMTIARYADGNPMIPLDNPQLPIDATVDDVRACVVRINNPVAGNYYTLLSFTVTQNQTFALTVITDTYGHGAGRNPESLRVQIDNGTKYDNVISDQGATQAAPLPNLIPDYLVFNITAKAGDVINVMGMKTTTDTRIGIGGVAFERISARNG